MLPDDDNDVMSGDVVPLLLMTNEPTELKLKTLELLYQSLSFGQLAYMDGKNPETGEIVPLLVGLQPEANNKVSIYPVAKLISKDDNVNYLVPDGQGNYSPLNVGESIDLGIDFSTLAGESEPESSGEEISGKAEGNNKTIH